MNLVAFDTETHLFQPGCYTPKIVCSSWAFGATPGVMHPVETLLIKGAQETCNELRDILSDKSFTITGANIVYDFGCAAAEDPSLLPLIFQAYDESRVIDIQLGLLLHFIAKGCVLDDMLLDPRSYEPLKKPDGKPARHISLEVATHFLTGRADAKKNDYWRKRYALLENVELDYWPQEAKTYPLDDAKNTYDCAVELLSGKYLNQHDQPNQARAAWALRLSSIWGMRTGAVYLDEVQEQYAKMLQQHIADFFPFGFLEKDGSDNKTEIKKAVVKAFNPITESCKVCFGIGRVKGKGSAHTNCKACDGTGLNPGKAPRTDGNGVASDRDTLEDSGDELLERFAKVSKTKKILQTYIPAMRFGTEHCLTTDANPLLNSGRSSYSGLIQTMPQKGGLRECFVARDGMVFSSVDYNQIELATLAQCLLWICGKSIMADTLNRGEDLHTAFAAQQMGVPYEEALRRVKAKDPIAKGFRQGAKAANFGFPGGMSAPALVIAQRKQGTHLCETTGNTNCGANKTTEWKGRTITRSCVKCLEVAENLRDRFFSAWPEMEQYFAYVKKIVNGEGTATQFVSKRLRGNLKFNACANTFFQGLAADGAKKALYRISRECYLDKTSPMYGSRVLIFIHDETFMEHREDVAHESAMRQTELMVNTMKEYTPDILIKAAPALCKRWYKEAEAVYDEKGRLKIWEPEK